MKALIKFRLILLKIFPSNYFLGKIYKLLFRLFCPKKITRNGFEMFIEGGDFFSSEYEPEVTKKLKEVVKASWKVADIGANIGYHTLTLSSLAAEVWAFEPCKNTFKYLTKNLEINKITNVKAINKAVSNKNGSAFLQTSSESGSNKISSSGEIIETIKLDDLNINFDLLKIDIEGHELQALQGMDKVLRNRPLLILEFNPEVNSNSKEMLDYLKTYNYKFYNLDGADFAPRGFTNILCK